LKNLTEALLPLIANMKAPVPNPASSPEKGAIEPAACIANDPHTPGTNDGRPYQQRRSPNEPLSFLRAKNLSVANSADETSISNALQLVEDRLNEIGLPIVEGESAPATPPMTPMPLNPHEWKADSVRYRISRALETNGIEPNRAQMDEYLDTFKTEVYPLYPFLTEDTITEIYSELWAAFSSLNDQDSEDITHLDRVVQGLLILALGRCTVSSRSHKGDGLHNAGWSLYCTAMDLQGSLLDMVNDDSEPLSSLHTLALVVSSLAHNLSPVCKLKPSR
jgi:hypothetical protein